MRNWSQAGSRKERLLFEGEENEAEFQVLKIQPNLQQSTVLWTQVMAIPCLWFFLKSLVKRTAEKL